MDHFQGVTAEIISNGQVLNLYNDPDSAEAEESHARHRYVEAVAGSTFQVKVDLTPEFNLYKMKPEHSISLGVKIDGNSKSSRRTSDPDFSVKQAQDLGKIEITVKRIRLQKLQVAQAPSTERIATVNEVPEKALKGRPIETTVRLVNARPASGPPVQTDCSRPIGGEAGKPLVINIYYRSRRALQMMGCIPRSPSPAIDISDDEPNEPVIKPESGSSTMDNSSMTRNAGSSDELLRQIQVLNARITDLERVNIKGEATNTGTVIKDEGVSVKREREEDDGNGGARQKRRIPVKIEHVDLTDD